MTKSPHAGLFLTMALWVVVVAVALGVRPPLPVDETRYLAVAWDMWLEGRYLVPHLNGDPYSDKPPLLFWLMTAGWHVFGVNEWWPRLVAPLFGLGSAWLTLRLARALWPARAEAGTLAVMILFGAIFWTVFATLTMFDMMLAFFALAAILGLVKAATEGGLGGFVLAGIAIGMGVLAKGPAILLHVLPVALAAPWWAAIGDRRRWYLGVTGAVALGAAVGLAWAVPAGMAGGEAYRDAIFWGQSTGRMVKSFAHPRAWWWYAAVLPGLVLPWLVWPPLWRAARRFGDIKADPGLRLCLVWFGTAFVAFSLISGKQLHYLLPEFPALALIAARLLVAADEIESWPKALDRLLPGVLAVVLGGLVMAAPELPLRGRTALILGEAATLWGGLIVVAGAMLILARDGGAMAQAARLVTISAFTVLAVHMAAVPVLAKRYDLGPMGAHLAALQADGRAIAYFGKYHGQFQFPGRLVQPIRVIGLKENDTAAFLAANPDGVVIAKYGRLPTQARPLFTHPFRSTTYAVWPAAALIANPGLGERR